MLSVERPFAGFDSVQTPNCEGSNNVRLCPTCTVRNLIFPHEQRCKLIDNWLFFTCTLHYTVRIVYRLYSPLRDCPPHCLPALAGEKQTRFEVINHVPIH